MPRYLRWWNMGLVFTVLVLGPLLYYRYQNRTYRNFHIVREGMLYRSGQMTLEGLQRKVYELGIKTVVSLRDAEHGNDTPPDIAEEEWCRKEEIKYVRIPPRPWEASDGSVPVMEGVNLFRAVLEDPTNYPVLVHCFAGIHRTGAYVAVYRMEHEGWSNARAIAEVKAMGYENLDDEWDIRGFLEEYRLGRPIPDRFRLLAARMFSAAANREHLKRGPAFPVVDRTLSKRSG